jgi:hypothetical protein
MGRGANNLLYGSYQQQMLSQSEFEKELNYLLENGFLLEANKMLFESPEWNNIVNRDLIINSVYKRIINNKSPFFYNIPPNGAGDRETDIKLIDSMKSFFEKQLLNKQPVTDHSVVDYFFNEYNIPRGTLFYQTTFSHRDLTSVKKYLDSHKQTEWLLAYDQAQIKGSSSYGQRKINQDLSVLLDQYYHKRFRKLLKEEDLIIKNKEIKTWSHMRIKDLIRNSLGFRHQPLFSDKNQKIITNRQLLSRLGEYLKNDLMIQEFFKNLSNEYGLLLSEQKLEKIFLN